MEGELAKDDDEHWPETHLFHDTVARISTAIPETLDLGTITVELTCITSSPSYFVMGAGCGTLFVFNKKLGRLARQLRTNNFEAVTCIHHISYLDDFIAIGYNTGTLIVMRLPSGREGGCTALSQFIDVDSHRRSPITCITISSDAKKVLSGDASGTVILSTVIFDTDEICHSFIFEGTSSIATLGFFNESAVVDNGVQLLVIDMTPTNDTHILINRTERAVVVGIRCTDSFIYLVERFRICKYSHSLLNNVVIPAAEVVGESCSISRAEWSLDGKSLAALSTSSVFVKYDIIHSQVLWRGTLSSHVYSSIVDFCVDTDDSIYYITRPRGVHRIGDVPIAKSLVEKEADSPIASLLSSPRKLLASSALRFSSGGLSFLNSAISVAKDISATSEVTSLFEDAWRAIDSRSGSQIVEVPIAVGIMEEETSFGTVTSMQTGVSDDRMIEEHQDTSIDVKEEARFKKASHVSRVNSCDTFDIDGRESVNEGSILALRREILGNSFMDCSPCRSGVSIESLPVCTADENSLVAEHLISSLIDPKEATFCLSRATSDTERRNESILDDEDDISNSPGVECFPYHSEATKQTSLEVNEADSATSAYEYLLLKSSTNLGASKTRSSTSIAGGVVQIDEILRKKVRKTVACNDHMDIWMKIILPYAVKSFTVGCEHIVICHKSKTVRIMKHEDVGSKRNSWIEAKWAADFVSMNDEETIIWRVYRNFGWCARDDLGPATRFDQCATDGGGVIEVAVAGNVSWYLTTEAVSLQMELPEKAIFSRVDRDWSLRSITVSEEAVWAIREHVGSLVVRVGLARCKMGLDWVEIILHLVCFARSVRIGISPVKMIIYLECEYILGAAKASGVDFSYVRSPEGPSKLVSVCVYRSYGFALDDTGQLWMSTGLDHHHPYGSSDAFFKVCLPAFDAKTPPVSMWTVRVASTGVYICTGKTLYVARSVLSGHRFPREVPPKFELLDNFSLLSAGSFTSASGCIHLCRQHSEIFVYRPEKRNFVTIALPPTSHAVLSLSGSTEKLSLIDSCGNVFYSDVGTSNWKAETSLPDAVCSITHSKISSWAITCTGEVLMLSHETSEWTSVPRPCDMSSNVVPTQVFASPNGIYVWIVAGGRAWARVNINERNPGGQKWMETYHTCDLSTLAVGDTVVWALDCCRQLLRLRGLAAGNPAGNYWRPITKASFRTISVDAQSELWAIDMENRLVRHLSDVFIPEKRTPTEASNSFELV